MEPLPISDKKAQALFQLVKKLNNPNIMKCDYFVDNGIFYLVRSYDDDYVTKISN